VDGSGTMKLSQIRPLAKDFHKSVTFYKDVMELTLGTYVQGMKYASFKTGDEVCARLKDKGVVFFNEPHDRKEWNARVAHLRDPDGNVIELYNERMDGASFPEGADPAPVDPYEQPSNAR
jgi:lactoylglutathione lyase